jgi:cyclopropane-fatty-acyl-phospholipid synthase
LRVNGLDERFKRLWEQYLCYCQAGFATGNIDVIQIAAHKDAHRHGSIHFETTRR